MSRTCECGDVCEMVEARSHDLRAHSSRPQSCPTQKYYVYELGDQDEQEILDRYPRFDTWEEAEAWAANERQCDSCVDCMDRGLDPRSTACYSLVCIASGRWLRRMVNGAWTKQRIRINRRVYDRRYKQLRRR